MSSDERLKWSPASYSFYACWTKANLKNPLIALTAGPRVSIIYVNLYTSKGNLHLKPVINFGHFLQKKFNNGTKSVGVHTIST